MNKIKHFMLPEHTNSLYEKEAISSIALAREVAAKINEIVDSINELASLDITWKQEQEGTIRKAVIYIKDNLLNKLNDLAVMYEKDGIFNSYVKQYTKELEKRIENLLSSNVSDGELLDIRVGANHHLYNTAGESVRSQLKSIINLVNNKNMLTTFYGGYHSVDAYGKEYSILDGGGDLKNFHEMCSDFCPVKKGETYTASVVTFENPLITNNNWLCVHSYDKNKNFIRREYAFESNESTLEFVYTVPPNVAYVRVMGRTYHCASIKLEKGVFATYSDLYSGNLMEKFPLAVDGCYTYTADSNKLNFAKPGENLEKSTMGIDCQGKKQMTVYVEDEGATWVSINFLNKDRIFVTENKPNRVVMSSSGKYVIDIPEDACTMFISARTKTLKELAVFFKENYQSDHERVYDVLFTNKQKLKEAISNLRTTPPVENYELKDIAHRGFSWGSPENTLHAFIKAYKQGFKYVECDLGFTSDNVPVLLHDYTVDRTSNGTGEIKDFTYEEVSKLDFGSWVSSYYQGTKIPTFEEFISLCRRLALYPYIEVKETTTSEQIALLIQIVKDYSMLNNVTWISFGFSQLAQIVSLVPTSRVGYVVNDLTYESINKTMELKTGSNHVFVDFWHYTNEVIEYAITNNIPVERWVINDEEEIKNQHHYISGVTSDKLRASEVLKNEVI